MVIFLKDFPKNINFKKSADVQKRESLPIPMQGFHEAAGELLVHVSINSGCQNQNHSADSQLCVLKVNKYHCSIVK